MAESVVSFVIQTLSSLLEGEAKLKRVRTTDIENLKDELESIQCFLKDADAKADRENKNEELKNRVKHVVGIAHRIEDVVDEYMLSMAQPPQYQSGIKGFLHKFYRLIEQLKRNRVVASEIEDIKKTIIEVKERSERYGLLESSPMQGSSSSGDHDPRVGSLYIEEAAIVGIETPRDELVDLLVDKACERKVISVVGMGGLGKTTLVRKVYNHRSVIGHFECRAWIDVSQTYKMEEVLQSIMMQFYEEEKRESSLRGIRTMDQLTEKLKECLEEKRYVVVFDDVWGIDLWSNIKHVLFHNNKGSRIIITTRNEEVAASCKESSFDSVYKLQPLPLEKAWQLFCNKAFQSDFGGRCPPKLKQLSLKILKKCGGLPLAIVAIGGLLSTKSKDVFQWQKLLDSLGAELECNPHLTPVNKILSLSYHELPYYLKSCFLYFGIFPEDYSIKSRRLIRLWIAEGFVKGKKGLTLEQVAEDYLTELVQRSLVQVSEVNIEEKAKSFRVHDLMREIILSNSKDLSFCQVVANGDSCFDKKIRRLSIHNSTGNDLDNIDRSPLRCIFLFELDKLPKSLMSTYSANFKLLKVLDFEDAPLNSIPEEVGNLFHLSYLSMRRTRVEKLPKSIGLLLNLQTLDLSLSLVQEVPIEINMLLKLRHLLRLSFKDSSRYGFQNFQGVKIHEGIRFLKDMQKLYNVEASQGNSLMELRELRQLRKLGIIRLRKEQGKVLCESIEKMEHLSSLALHSVSEDEILDIHHISYPPKSLQNLELHGRLGNMPTWIPQLEHLVKLRFSWTGLIEDPLKYLQALPSLLDLTLLGTYAGEQLYFEKGGFQKLKALHLAELNGLNNLIIVEGALPILGKLFIGPCPLLEKMPLGIHHLRKLTTLLFIDMPRELLLPLHPNKGELHWVVEHIPVIFARYTREGGGFDTYKLQ